MGRLKCLVEGGALIEVEWGCHFGEEFVVEVEGDTVLVQDSEGRIHHHGRQFTDA